MGLCTTLDYTKKPFPKQQQQKKNCLSFSINKNPLTQLVTRLVGREIEITINLEVTAESLEVIFFSSQ